MTSGRRRSSCTSWDMSITRGRCVPCYLRAMESLGALRDPEAVEPLTAALYRGEWWAPRRTARLRAAAASALARIGTPAAVEALRKAAASRLPRHPRRRAAGTRTAVAREQGRLMIDRWAAMTDKRMELADECLRRLAAAIRSATLYSSSHPIIAPQPDSPGRSSQRSSCQPADHYRWHRRQRSHRWRHADGKSGYVRRRGPTAAGRWHRAHHHRTRRGESTSSRASFDALASPSHSSSPTASPPPFPSLPHIRVGRVQVEERTGGNLGDMATIRQLYTRCGLSGQRRVGKRSP